MLNGPKFLPGKGFTMVRTGLGQGCGRFLQREPFLTLVSFVPSW